MGSLFFRLLILVGQPRSYVLKSSDWHIRNADASLTTTSARASPQPGHRLVYQRMPKVIGTRVVLLLLVNP
jgi:hypothetical protein